MKKNLFTGIIIPLFISINCLAQGWVGDGSNTIYSVNSGLSLTPISVGIGTSSPAAQFHVTGSIRFSGLSNDNSQTRVLVQNSSGDLFYRDASSLTSSAWLLTGNSGTNPSTNFLGTTDNTRLVFRANNTEYMTILANGNVGVGLNAPESPLHVYSGTADNQAFISGSAPSIRFFSGTDWNTTAYNTSGRLGLATANANYVATSHPGDIILQVTDTVGALILGTNGAGGNGLERMRISKGGFVGISTTTPTAKLHVDCQYFTGQSTLSNVRFENLQSGSGTPLVIDNNGYVYKDNSARLATSSQDLQDQIDELKKEIQELKAIITKGMAGRGIPLFKDRASLSNNQPNPFNNETLIGYHLPAETSTAVCQVFNLEGKLLNSYPLSTSVGDGQLKIDSRQLAAGMYLYSLVVDGKLVDTKKMIINK